MEIVLTAFDIWMAFIILLLTIACLTYINSNGFDGSVFLTIGIIIFYVFYVIMM